MDAIIGHVNSVSAESSSAGWYTCQESNAWLMIPYYRFENPGNIVYHSRSKDLYSKFNQTNLMGDIVQALF